MARMEYNTRLRIEVCCNDLKLELRLHLGKDLRKYKGLDRSGKA